MVKTACFSSRLACVTLDVLRCKAVVSIKNLALHMTALYQYLINGRNEASISPLDRGLAYGDGVFRTLAVRYGQVDHWDRHYHKPVSYTHLRAHETDSYLVCRLLLEKKKKNKHTTT